LNNIRLSSLKGLAELKKRSGVGRLVITGGTERGHAPGRFSHRNGYKIDLGLNSNGKYRYNKVLDQARKKSRKSQRTINGHKLNRDGSFRSFKFIAKNYTKQVKVLCTPMTQVVVDEPYVYKVDRYVKGKAKEEHAVKNRSGKIKLYKKSSKGLFTIFNGLPKRNDVVHYARVLIFRHLDILWKPAQ